MWYSSTSLLLIGTSISERKISKWSVNRECYQTLNGKLYNIINMHSMLPTSLLFMITVRSKIHDLCIIKDIPHPHPTCMYCVVSVVRNPPISIVLFTSQYCFTLWSKPSAERQTLSITKINDLCVQTLSSAHTVVLKSFSHASKGEKGVGTHILSHPSIIHSPTER